MGMKTAKFRIGQVVRHRLFPFRGVIFDVDPQFNNTEEWYQAIPAEVRPRKDQPFYHLLAENDETEYIAYVSEQNSPRGPDRRAGPPSATQRVFRSGSGRKLRPQAPCQSLRRQARKAGYGPAFRLFRASEAPQFPAFALSCSSLSFLAKSSLFLVTNS